MSGEDHQTGLKGSAVKWSGVSLNNRERKWRKEVGERGRPVHWKSSKKTRRRVYSLFLPVMRRIHSRQPARHKVTYIESWSNDLFSLFSHFRCLIYLLWLQRHFNVGCLFFYPWHPTMSQSYIWTYFRWSLIAFLCGNAPKEFCHVESQRRSESRPQHTAHVSGEATLMSQQWLLFWHRAVGDWKRTPLVCLPLVEDVLE